MCGGPTLGLFSLGIFFPFTNTKVSANFYPTHMLDFKVEIKVWCLTEPYSKLFFLTHFLFLTRCLKQGNCRTSDANCTMLCCVLCPQGAIGGLILGISLSFWVGVGAFFHPASPNNTHPLPLSTEDCNLQNITATPVHQTVILDTGYSSLQIFYYSTTRLQGKRSKLINIHPHLSNYSVPKS